MARARPGLELAVNEILERQGRNGKRLSYRQVERLTGLSPATVGELAKGNARTPETVRRFAVGLGEDVGCLLLLAGFVPEESEAVRAVPAPSSVTNSLPEWMEADEREWLGRFGRALAKMPPGRERDLWKDNLRRDTELLEAFLECLTSTERHAGNGAEPTDEA